MGSISIRGGKLYVKVKAVDGTWKRIATGHPNTSEGRAEAETMIADLERKVAVERSTLARVGARSSVPLTVRGWAELWRDERRAIGKDWEHEFGRLEHHVLPVIGDVLIADLRTSHVVALFRRVRTEPSAKTGKSLSPRTVHNVYGVFAVMVRDAVLAGKLDHAPATLDERHLGRKVDADPEWRASALFTRDEVQMMISSSKIPWDRRVAYAIELLAGPRTGEVAALRWQHYDSAKRPLGELRIARAYNYRRNKLKGTKTDAIKHVPVHPTLAEILDEWKENGWVAMMGREPTPEDLIVPMPPDDAARRTSERRHGEPFRSDDYARKRWVDFDEPALGWRHRRHYDTRATFITLALEDGADRDVIESRVTHTKPSRSAFDMYNRGLQWERTCAELMKLKIVRLHQREAGVLSLPGDVDALTSDDHEGGPDDRGPSMVQSVKFGVFLDRYEVRAGGLEHYARGSPISNYHAIMQ